MLNHDDSNISAGDNCPCCSGKTYSSCCQKFHHGLVSAGTAEELMRSRYSAYVLGLSDYLLRTWHSSTKPAALNLDTQTQWIGLEIVDRAQGSHLDTRGIVEFKAHYAENGAPAILHERSDFVKESGKWYYVSGQFR